MFKKKDLAIAITMALSVSPASFAQTPMDEPVEQTPERLERTKAGVSGTEAGTIAGVPMQRYSCRTCCGLCLYVVDDNLVLQ